MKKLIIALPVLALTLPLSGTAGDGGEVEEFDEFDVRIEINATDGDAGLQGKLDGEAWAKARVLGPDGRGVFNLNPRGALGTQGLTELQWESDEPTFDEFSLEDFLERFPEGEYTAEARTIEGGLLRSTSDLTHDLPAAPVVTSFKDGDVIELDGNNLVITWEEVTDDFLGGPLGSEIICYEIVAEFEGEDDEGEEFTQVLTIDVRPDTFVAEIPADFLLPDREYKLEVGAFEETLNSTYTEVIVCTTDDDPN